MASDVWVQVRTTLLLLTLLAACGDPARSPANPVFATQRDVPPIDPRGAVATAPLTPQGNLLRQRTAAMPRDAKAVGDRWIAWLEERGLVGGYGLAGKGPDGPVQSIDVLISAEDFDALVVAEGWGHPPAHIEWRFVSPLVRERISRDAAALVRYWPASTTRTGAQHGALIGGRVVLEDGCFWVEHRDRPRELAWFHAETGLDRDAEGYLVLVDRVTGRPRGRVGEHMVAAGPNSAPDAAALAALRNACGGGDVFNIGNPQSQALFDAR
jgi:hypothetical protein